MSIWFHLWYLERMSYSKKVPMDIDTRKMQDKNILTAWQTPVSVQVLIGWLQVQVTIFFCFAYFSNMLCALKLMAFRPHGPTDIQALPSTRYPNHIHMYI